jgi:hypothetical protein
LTVALYFSFDHSVVNTTVKRKRQHYGQKKKTTLWSKLKDNIMVRKRQHYGQKKKTTLWSKEKDNNVVLSFSFYRSVVFFF